KAFLKICSNPRNLTTLAVKEGWKRKPPLNGPSVLLNCTRYPLLTWTLPASSSQVTRKAINRSGSEMRSRIPCSTYSGCCSNTGCNESNTSQVACRNSDSPGLRSLSFLWMAFIYSEDDCCLIGFSCCAYGKCFQSP